MAVCSETQMLCRHTVPKKRHWRCILQHPRTSIDFGNFWQRRCWVSMLSNGDLLFHLSYVMSLHYLRKRESLEMVFSAMLGIRRDHPCMSSDWNEILHGGWSSGVVLRFEFYQNHLSSFGAVGVVKICPFPLTWPNQWERANCFPHTGTAWPAHHHDNKLSNQCHHEASSKKQRNGDVNLTELHCPGLSTFDKTSTEYWPHIKLVAMLRGSRWGVQSASLIMTSLMTS